MLERIGGTGARKGCAFRNFHVKKAPIRVARLPKITSGINAPPMRFPRMHPINRPGIAAGVKTGRIVRASAMRTWISLKEIGAKTYVSTT